MLSKKVVVFMSLLLFFFFTAGGAMAEIRPGAITISPMIGGFDFDGDLHLDEEDFPNLFSYGLGYNINKTFAVELLLGYTEPYHAGSNQDVDVYQWELDFLWHLLPENSLTPYLEAGFGGLTYDPEDSGTQTRAMGNLGLGLKWSLNDMFALRADVRKMLAIDSLVWDTKGHHWSYNLGVTMSFGGEVKQPPPPPAPMPAPAPKPAPAPVKDSDGDGVPDNKDKCPDTPKGCPVDAKGCPLDSDGDGVIDCKDKCPNTPKGVTVDERGCWVISCTVLFDFDSANLKSEAQAELDKAYEIIKADELKIEIQGHTDSIGTEEYNQGLSERRANAVKSYLVEKGIDEDRLTTMGFGESKPAASNDTKEGRMKNRRVEFKSMD